MLTGCIKDREEEMAFEWEESASGAKLPKIDCSV